MEKIRTSNNEHLEDLMFNEGVNGTRKAINFLRDLRDMLAGHSSSKKNITVKWDGAPAIFIGVDPSDNRFFIAKKGLFNKEPKMYKSQADIDRDTKLNPELKKKFTVALREFSKLGVKKGVYQGDLMFTKGDVSVEKIDGEKYYTFQPNTIVYAVPTASNLGNKIAKSSIGVVWHTTYEGDSIETMKASFGKAIVNKFNDVPSIWMDDANYKDVSGNATFTESETKEITSILSDAGKIFNKIPANLFSAIANDEDLKIRVKTFNNSFVRSGKPFPPPFQHVKQLMDFVYDYYQKEIDSKKTPKAKEKYEVLRTEAMKIFSNKKGLEDMFALMSLLVQAKTMIVNKLNAAASLGTFLRTANGFKVTQQEGYVAIDHIQGTVKLVDRLEFSKANFSPEIVKGWMR